MTHRPRRRLPILIGATLAATATFAVTHSTPALAAAPTGSSQVAYIADFNGGSTGGYNLFDSFGVTPPGGGAPPGSGSYTTASPATSLTVTIHNLDVSSLSSGISSLSGIDTVVLFDVCNIGSDPSYLKTINAFVDTGGKLIIMDGAQCVDGNGGVADFTKFEKAFSDNYALPDPHDPFGTPVPKQPYSFVEPASPSTDRLTANQPDCGTTPCNEPGNSVTDASVINPTTTGWCESLGGTDANGISGAMEAYTRNTAGSGLIVYEGEAFAASAKNGETSIVPTQKHLRLLFDNFLTQQINPDTLPCTNQLSPPVNAPESPLSIIFPVISLGILGAIVVPAIVRRRRLITG